MFVGLVQLKMQEADNQLPHLPPKDVIVSEHSGTILPVNQNTCTQFTSHFASLTSSTESTATSASRPTRHPTNVPFPSPHLAAVGKAYGQGITCPSVLMINPSLHAGFGVLVKTNWRLYDITF